MKTELARVGARVVDSFPFSLAGGAPQARALKAAGVDGLVGYLGSMSAARVGHLLDAGLSFMPVTIAGEYRDGADDEIRQLKALDLPAGCTVWLDLEAEKADAAIVIGQINAWAKAIAGAGYQPGLYVGVPQPLTSDELWSLSTVRYWRGMGSTRDRKNALAEPARCGWCMTQVYPTQIAGGVKVDFNIIGQDYLGRVPSWVVS